MNTDKKEKARGRFRDAVTLFLDMLVISAFTFGGGFVITSLMKKKFVDRRHLLDEEEMLDLIALAQSAPGAIAVNAATLVGYRVAGGIGIAGAVVGTMIPPIVILTLVSYLYDLFASNVYVATFLGGMQIGVAAVIADVVLTLSRTLFRERKIFPIALAVLAFVAAFFFKINVILIILAAVVAGVIRVFVCRKKGGDTK